MKKQNDKATAKRTRVLRPYPTDSLEESIVTARAIKDQNAGNPMSILDLAIAVGRKPNSSAFRTLITSSSKYGLTTGHYKSLQITLTQRGLAVVAPRNETESSNALKEAALEPPTLQKFYTQYNQNKLPNDEIALNVLERDCGVPPEISAECLQLVKENGALAGLFREHSGSTYVDLTSGQLAPADEIFEPETAVETPAPPADGGAISVGETQSNGATNSDVPDSATSGQIFIGHGKNVKPVEELEKVLTRFKIPFLRAVNEPNRARPISQKVADTMRSCSASVLVFTADEELRDLEGNPVWRPNENVIHELGAASVMHGGNIVIFKEEGVDLPSNFRDIGYISFEKDRLAAKGVELVSELIAFGLLNVTVR